MLTVARFCLDPSTGWSYAFQPAHRAWQRSIWRLVLTVKVRLLERRRHRRLTLEYVGGLPILVLPDVFNPRLFRTGEALARYLDSEPLQPGTRVLDVGTGSGIGAIFAARRGAQVVASDISPHAVRCARINALLNGLEARIDVRQGDLFETVRGERFDLVLCNPPYFPGTPRDDWEHAWRSDNLIERFAAGLADVLLPDGRALVMLSSDMVDAAHYFTRSQLDWHVAWQRDLINERLVILEGRRYPRPEASP
jgi:release factor glutamine methyltransferase